MSHWYANYIKSQLFFKADAIGSFLGRIWLMIKVYIFVIFVLKLFSPFEGVDAVLCHPDPSTGLLGMLPAVRPPPEIYPQLGRALRDSHIQWLVGVENRGQSPSHQLAKTVKVIPAPESAEVFDKTAFPSCLPQVLIPGALPNKCPAH